MAVHLDHIGVPARDKKTSAEFLAGILGLEVGAEFGPFIPVKVANGVTLDYVDSDDFRLHHCAFLVSDEEFDAILARIREAGITHYADPGPRRVGEINHRYGGRGFYFDDPNGHAMEVMTTTCVTGSGGLTVVPPNEAEPVPYSPSRLRRSRRSESSRAASA